MKQILSVDIGTTSAKALVVNSRGEVLTLAQEFYPTYTPQQDYCEQDPREIFLAVKKIMRMAVSHVGGQVQGVSFSSAMHSLMAVTEQGEALTPLITWADLRSKNESRELNNSGGKEIYMETGTPVHPMSPLCKLLWLKKNRPELFKSGIRFIGIKEYIWFHLFRTFVIDHSMASATGLFNAVTLSWSEAALKKTGISPQQLSTPCSVYSVFTDPGEHHAKEFGLAREIPWIIGASDGCLANLGSGAMEEQTLSLTVGTSGAVRKAVKSIAPDVLGRTFHYLLDEKHFITGGATNNGAVVIQWFAEKILNQRVDIQSFGEQAASVPPGSQGLLFLPYLLGERAPVSDPETAGVFFGLHEHHTREHMMRAILEGIAYNLFSTAEIIEENSGPCRKIIASGGLIQSSHWLQIISHLFGKEVHVRGSEDASTLGAALMGFRAVGIAADFQFPMEKRYKPDPALHAKYLAYFAVYKNLYPTMSDSFHSLHQIANR